MKKNKEKIHKDEGKMKAKRFGQFDAGTQKLIFEESAIFLLNV